MYVIEFMVRGSKHQPDEPQLISFYGLVGGAQKGQQSVTFLLLYAR
jgi:hypothetical protein